MSRRLRIKPHGWLHFFGFASLVMTGVALTVDGPNWLRLSVAFVLGVLGLTLVDLAYRHGRREGQ